MTDLRLTPGEYQVAVEDAPMSVVNAIREGKIRALDPPDGRVEVQFRGTRIDGVTRNGNPKRYGRIYARFIPNEETS